MSGRPRISESYRVIDIREIYWAAGFLEGEGSFVVSSALKSHHLTIEAAQTEIEPLERLRALFGGRICGPYSRTKPDVKRCKPIYHWTISGGRAIEAAYTLYALMSARRKEAIRKMVRYWMAKQSRRYNMSQFRYAGSNLRGCITEVIGTQGAITRAQISTTLGASSGYVKKVLSELVATGLIRRVTKGPGATYSLAA